MPLTSTEQRLLLASYLDSEWTPDWETLIRTYPELTGVFTRTQALLEKQKHQEKLEETIKTLEEENFELKGEIRELQEELAEAKT